MSDKVHKVAILGSGPAGLTAAIYAARANLSPVCIEGGDVTSKTDLPGGQLMLTTEVENYPGFPDGILGPELMEKFRKQAERFGTQFIGGRVVSCDLSKRPFTLQVHDTLQDTRATVLAHSVIVATGASAKYLGLPVEQKLLGHGVTTCATCDGAFFRKKQVVVVGGGDSAMEEANFLTRYADTVYVVHRRETFRASKIMIDRAKSNPKIKWKLNRAVVDIIADKKYLKAVELEGTEKDKGAKERLEVGPDGGLFVAIGHSPNSDIFGGQLALHDNGYIKLVDGSSRTSVEGVFASGDIHDHVYRQAITAAGAGCRAAIDAERWLEAQGL
jgi:thioredoxin reductase (NADPH)